MGSIILAIKVAGFTVQAVKLFMERNKNKTNIN